MIALPPGGVEEPDISDGVLESTSFRLQLVHESDWPGASPVSYYQPQSIKILAHPLLEYKYVLSREVADNLSLHALIYHLNGMTHSVLREIEDSARSSQLTSTDQVPTREQSTNRFVDGPDLWRF
jgi:hypothetical protein